MIIWRIIVGIFMLFRLPYQIFRRLFNRETMEEQDARKMLDVLKNWKDDDDD